MRCIAAVFAAGVLAGFAAAFAGQSPAEPAWAGAYRAGPMNAAEARDLMKRLTQFVFDNHLKKDEKSQQRGMIYEYLDVPRKGQFDQFVQGEALDTMHDGAWFAVAMVNAMRVSDEPLYRQMLTRWQLPFYCLMLNNSDRLFSGRVRHVRPDRQNTWSESKEWLFQEGEKGFVPYWWDDGASVSLERRYNRSPLPEFPAFCWYLANNQPNPQFLLRGWSLGSSNHMAQDLAVMLQQAWLVLRESAADAALAREVAEAAKNLHECRMRHHGHIPACCAAFGLTNSVPDELKRANLFNDDLRPPPANHHTRAFGDAPPGQRRAFPTFMDDAQYRYYHGIAGAGGTVPESLAFRTVYDAFTEPISCRVWCDDAQVPPGINFDEAPRYAVDGRPTEYRSDRKFGWNAVGARMGAQNMVVCGWALQILGERKGIWDKRYRELFANDHRVYFEDETSGLKSRAPAPTVLGLGDAALRLTARRRALIIAGEARGETLSITFFAQPDGKEPRAVIRLGRDKTASAANGRGQELLIRAAIDQTADGFSFSVELPYTLAREQKAPWLNLLEHMRCSVQCGAAVKNLYCASDEADVKAWLEHELGCGLRTWDAVFREKGYLPCSINRRPMNDNWSDSGAYAHVISAAAQWVMCLENRKDWEVHRIPAPPR